MDWPDPSTLALVKYPAPLLRRRCKAVPDDAFGPGLVAVVERMFDLMGEHEGVGIAAPQCGLDARVFVMDPGDDLGGERAYVNPVLSDADGDEDGEEGCLSLPDVRVGVRRATAIRIRAKSPSGEDIDEVADDFRARVWQHEADHLDGRLIIDAMSPSETMANKAKLKELEAAYKRA